MWRPVEYHNNVNGVNPWRRVLSYVVPVIAIAVVFNLPKFFEATVQEKTIVMQVENEDGEVEQVRQRKKAVVRGTKFGSI